MNDELEEGEVAIDSLETDVQDVLNPLPTKCSNFQELKTHKEKKKVKKSKNSILSLKPPSNQFFLEPTPNKVESPEDPFPSNPGPYERIEKKYIIFCFVKNLPFSLELKSKENNILVKTKMSLLPQHIKPNLVNSFEKVKRIYFLISHNKGSCQKGNDCTFSHDIQVGQPDVIMNFLITYLIISTRLYVNFM